MSLDEIAACMVSSWYPLFRNVTFKTVILPLPQNFVDYLVADGVHLPEDTEAFSKRAGDPYATDDEWDSDSSSQSEQQVPEFPDLMAQMHSAIAQLGGTVAPKFTWSCPKDAVWMTLGHTLACHNPVEVLLLLKSSDRVAHDICHALEGCCPDAASHQSQGTLLECTPGDVDTADGGSHPPEAASPSLSCSFKQGGLGDSHAGSASGAAAAGSAAGGQSAAAGSGEPTAARMALPAVQHVLALRRWHDLRPEREFRCFVRNQEVVGISQRDVTEFYPSLAEDKQQIQHRILEFHQQHIKGRFPLPHYTYDVYVATTADAVKLVDFNPIAGTTAPLLFAWEDLPFRDVIAAQAAPAGVSSAAAAPAHAARGKQGQAAAAGGVEEQLAAVGAAEDEGAAESAAGASYVEQLRQVQALSLSDSSDLAANGSCDQAGKDGDASASCCGAADSATAAPSPVQEPEAQSTSIAALQFRIITEPVCMRPNKLAYGVPFDFVDASEGSALDQLMKQMDGGPDKLWDTLRAKAA